MNERHPPSRPLPSPLEIHRQLPSTASQQAFVHRSRATVRDILEGRSPCKLLVVGPCSLHDITEAKEYARRLHQLAQQLRERYFIVMRTYFEKPRTAVGWKGLLYDPDLDGTGDIEKGLRLARQLLLDLADMGIPAGTEFLDPMTPHYLSDLISWSCVGARTSASQIHRQMASNLPMPVGFKNAVDGDCGVAINGVQVAKAAHTYIGIDIEGRIARLMSRGNPYAHVVLRGGEVGSNFDSDSINSVYLRLKSLGVSHRLLVDCSHDNSRKNHCQQPAVVEAVVEQMAAESSPVAGLLLESYLCAGSQNLTDSPNRTLRYGVSLTDACLDWQATEQLLLWANKRIAAAPVSSTLPDVYAPQTVS